MIFSKTNLSTLFIITFHIVGFFGLTFTETRPFFLGLVPFHILLMSGILFANFNKIPIQNIVAVAVVIIFGYLIEVVGVHTGVIFGKYFYGYTLGIKILSVPIIIGLNWFIVVFSVGGYLRSILKSNKLMRTILGAFFLVGLDFFIEPVAVKLGYWSWANNIIPFQNYLGWFFVSLFMMAFYNYYDFKKTNPTYKTLFIAQLIFFIALNISLK